MVFRIFARWENFLGKKKTLALPSYLYQTDKDTSYRFSFFLEWYTYNNAQREGKKNKKKILPQYPVFETWDFEFRLCTFFQLADFLFSGGNDLQGLSHSSGQT